MGYESGKDSSLEKRLAEVIKSTNFDKKRAAALFKEILSENDSHDPYFNFVESMLGVIDGKSDRIEFTEVDINDVFDCNVDTASVLMDANILDISEVFTNMCREMAGERDIDVLFLKGKLAMCKKNYEKAAEIFREGSKQKKAFKAERELFTFYEGKCYLYLRKFEKALEQFSKMEKLIPKKNLGKALAYYYQENYNDALKIAEKEIKLRGLDFVDPSQLKICIEIYTKQGNIDDALMLKFKMATSADYKTNDIPPQGTEFIFRDENNNLEKISLNSLFFPHIPAERFKIRFPISCGTYVESIGASDTLGDINIPMLTGNKNDREKIVLSYAYNFFYLNKEAFQISQEYADSIFLNFYNPGKSLKGELSDYVMVPLEQFGFSVNHPTQ